MVSSGGYYLVLGGRTDNALWDSGTGRFEGVVSLANPDSGLIIFSKVVYSILISHKMMLVRFFVEYSQFHVPC